MKYAEGATHELPGKNAPEISAMIGSFAEQGINVVTMTVKRRSFHFQ